MAWTTPRDWVTGETVTAALLNAQVRDNIEFLAGEVDGSSSVSTQALTGSFTNIVTVTLAIPATWGSWKCYADASFTTRPVAGFETVEIKIRIDGTDASETQTMAVNNRASGAINGRRTGMTTTGDRAINLQARDLAVADGAVMNSAFVYARAVRLT